MSLLWKKAVRDVFTYEQGEDSGHVIRHRGGYVDYEHLPGQHNEVWWVSSPTSRSGIGTALIEEMQRRHPAPEIHWGDASHEGYLLARSYHRKHPEIRANIAGRSMNRPEDWSDYYDREFGEDR